MGGRFSVSVTKRPFPWMSQRPWLDDESDQRDEPRGQTNVGCKRFRGSLWGVEELPNSVRFERTAHHALAG